MKDAIKWPAARLSAELRSMAQTIDDEDSFEGHIFYSAMNDHCGPNEFLVSGVYRIGNSLGQGGVRLINGDLSDEGSRPDAAGDIIDYAAVVDRIRKYCNDARRILKEQVPDSPYPAAVGVGDILAMLPPEEMSDDELHERHQSTLLRTARQSVETPANLTYTIKEHLGSGRFLIIDSKGGRSEAQILPVPDVPDNTSTIYTKEAIDGIAPTLIGRTFEGPQ
jgi:hypothetical protein